MSMSRSEASRPPHPVLIFFLALALFLAGNGRHSLWDRDETRFSEATREMLASGDWIVPRLNGEVRYDKPILIYWLMSLGIAVTGINAFSVRIPSSLAGALMVLLVWRLTRRMGASRQGAAIAALAATVCPLLLLVSKAATTDATLTCTVVGAMTLLWDMRTRPFAWWRDVAFWAVLALSALVKGPPGLAVVALAAAAFALWNRLAPLVDPTDRETDGAGAPPWWMRSAAGLAVFLAIGLPWGILVSRATDGEFLRVAVGHHVVERSQRAFEGHSGPFFYYIGLLPALMAPVAAPALAAGRWAWGRRRQLRATRFLWSWFVPGLAMFSVVRTKLPHYVAPLLPSLCVMVGLWWSARQGDAREAGPSAGWWRGGAAVAGLLGAGFLAGIPVAFLHSKAPRELFVYNLLIAVVLGGSLLWGAWQWWRRRARGAIAAWVVGAAVSYLLMASVLLPAMEPWRASPAVGGWLRAHAPKGTRLVVETLDEASLLFYSRMLMEEVGKDDADEALGALGDLSRPAALVATRERWEKWAREAPALSPRVSVRFSERFYIFRRDKWRDIVVVGNW